MYYRSLGQSGLLVPVMALGTTNFGISANAKAGIGERIATRLVDLAIDCGANFFDVSTAEPDTQLLLAKLLSKRRSAVLLGVRVHTDSAVNALGRGASRLNLIRACEQSLLRLGTDYLDLLQIDGFDQETPLEETLSTLESLIQAGKVRYIGCSGFAAWQVMKALSIAEKRGWTGFTAHQFTYSLAERNCEVEVLPCGADQKVGSLVRGGLAGGALAGNFGISDQPPRMRGYIDCLGEVASETGASKGQVALAWLLHRPTVSSAIVGASCSEQLEANLDAINLRLSGDQIARLDEVTENPSYRFGKAEKAVPSRVLEATQNISAKTPFRQTTFLPG